jgi:hypothetical protein
LREDFARVVRKNMQGNSAEDVTIKKRIKPIEKYKNHAKFAIDKLI